MSNESDTIWIERLMITARKAADHVQRGDRRRRPAA
jgi:hypothetical protein